MNPCENMSVSVAVSYLLVAIGAFMLGYVIGRLVEEKEWAKSISGMRDLNTAIDAMRKAVLNAHPDVLYDVVRSHMDNVIKCWNEVVNG